MHHLGINIIETYHFFNYFFLVLIKYFPTSIVDSKI
jgi:hypothetical protein